MTRISPLLLVLTIAFLACDKKSEQGAATTGAATTGAALSPSAQPPSPAVPAAKAADECETIGEKWVSLLNVDSDKRASKKGSIISMCKDDMPAAMKTCVLKAISKADMDKCKEL
jgi:hypothetical protein